MSDTTADLILNHLHQLGHPQPSRAVAAALPNVPEDTVRTTLQRMGRDGRLVALQLFGGHETFWTPPRNPGAACRHPVTYRNELGHQCVGCGSQVTVR